MNKRIEEISAKLSKRVAIEEKVPGYNPYADDLYYVMFKLEVAVLALDAMKEVLEAKHKSLIDVIDRIKSE